MTDDLSAQRIVSAISGGFGSPLQYFDELGSTNSLALEWADEGAPEGAVVVTDHQTAGRGRWGRSWSSAPGSLLQFSLVLRPPSAVDVGLLTTLAGVACAEAIESVAGLLTTIKWPNDVMLDDRKCAGILIESRVTDSRLTAAVVGIGVNVVWDEDELPPELRERATSLSSRLRAAGRDERVDRSELLAAILSRLEGHYRSLRDGVSSEILTLAKLRSTVLGKHVGIRYMSGETVAGRAVTLSSSGALVLDVDGEPTEIEVGEIEHVLDP